VDRNPDPKEETRALVAASGQTAIVIAAFFFAKDTLHDIPAAPLVLMRSLLAAVILAGMVRWRGRFASLSRAEMARLACLGLLAVPINQGLFLWGLSKTTAAHAGLLYSLTPALVLVLRAFSGAERVTPARIVGVVLALAGVLLVLNDPVRQAPPGASRQSGADPFLGDMLILCAVVAWAAYTAFSVGVVERLGTLQATAGTLGFGALLFVPIGLWSCLHSDWHPGATPLSAWLGLAWLVVMSSVVSYLAWYYAIKRLDPSRVAVFNNLQPIGTALGQWSVFGLLLGPAFLAGGALTIAGVITTQRSAR
jgi:drug/metabolite transporter (DMT)-like permease